MSSLVSPTRLSRLAVGLLVFGLATQVDVPKSRGQDKEGVGRIQRRTYKFKEADSKEMEYALYVPSTYDKSKKTPLIVALHGLGGNPQQMIRSRGLTTQAEKYGYIVVAPMGYNSQGWYGSRGTGGGGRSGRSGRPSSFSGFNTPGTILSSRMQETLNLSDEQKKHVEELQKQAEAKLQGILTDDQNKQLDEFKNRFGRGGTGGRGFGRGGFGRGGFGNSQNEPDNLGELSEKDVMNVVELVRKEFTVDDNRVYLIGHSMGGAGTWHLGTKYSTMWAGLAPIAPAAFGRPTGLEKLADIPVIVVQGDADTLVRPEGARRWVEELKKQKVPHEYLEIRGAGHGDVISKGMSRIFEFFEEQHKKKEN